MSIRVIREFLGRTNQERHEQRLALFLAEAAKVLKGVPGPLTRQLLQPALMDGARHAFIEPDSANGAQLFAKPKKIHWRRPSDGLAQPSQAVRSAIGNKLVQLMPLDQC